MRALEYYETLPGGRAKFSTSSGKTGGSLGFEIKESYIRESKDVESALAEALSWGAQALFIDPGALTYPARHRIAEFALQHRLPSGFVGLPFVEAGGLFSYAVTGEESWALVTRALEYVDRILRGARPTDLPVEQPRNYELIINAKTAKVLGLKIPQSILLRADRVIE